MVANILVIGASGLIGRRITDYLGNDRVVPTFNTTSVDGGLRFDIARMRLRDIVDLQKGAFSHAVLLPSVTSIDFCAKYPEDSGKVNVSGLTMAIDDLAERGVTPIFVSSDAVFNGLSPLRRDDEAIDPILVYGKQKGIVEHHLLAHSPKGVVIRISKVISARPSERTLFTEWLSAVQQGQEILCAEDQWLTPVDLDDVVAAVGFFVSHEHSGIFNVCGSERVSRIDLLTRLLAAAPPDFRMRARIKRCHLADIPVLETRPLDCSMSNEKYRHLSGLRITPIDETATRLMAAAGSLP